MSDKQANNLVTRAAIGVVKLYRAHISPHTPPACRYVPTCSEYALTSFERYGFAKGFTLSITRIMRCNPWNPGGFDPVP